MQRIFVKVVGRCSGGCTRHNVEKPNIGIAEFPDWVRGGNP